MVTHFAAEWHHNHADEPIWLWQELDAERYELRKVEEFRNGNRVRADEQHQAGRTRLGEVPTPPLDEIEADDEFTVHALTSAQFEAVWRSAAYDT